MAQFPEKPISIPKEKWDLVVKFFSSDRCSDQEIKEQIKNTYEESGYLLDPHTATGVRASNNLESKDQLVVTMATAHPAKFEAVVKEATGLTPPQPEEITALGDKPERCADLPNDLTSVMEFVFGISK